MKVFKGNSGNSILLAIVKAFTTLSGILSTMIVSHALSLQVYGTYSQTVLIVTTATNLSALGLVDAVNYFYNRSASEEKQKKYINTIFGLQCMSGLIAGAVILVSAKQLTQYFKNPMLYGYLWLIALRPLFSNLNVSLQYLQVSIGKAKSVAIRNAAFAVVRLVVFAIVAYWVQDITIILAAFLIFEIFITLFFGWSFIKEKFLINPLHVDLSKIREIFSYSIPMGIYVLTNSLCRDIDKMLIGGWCTTEQYAIYANCATLLPFDIVTASFLTVLIPILTRYFGTKDYEHGRLLFKNYLRIGYFTSFSFTAACMLLSHEMILFLYGDKYLSGNIIFILYTMVDMVKFANMSIVLSANGQTKTLMVCSAGSLVANTILNVLFYRMFGLIGPAIATVVVTVGLTFILAQMSANALKTTIVKLLDWKEIIIFIVELVVVGGACSAFRVFFTVMRVNTIITLIVVAGIYIGAMLFINRKKLSEAMKELNKLH